MLKKFTHWFDQPPQQPLENHTCSFPNCQNFAPYRAPKSRHHVDNAVSDDWYWFCLPHIRQYNASWDYYVGMTEKEINKERASAVTWDRPTWRFSCSPYEQFQEMKDPFDLFQEGSFQEKSKKPTRSSEEIEALKILDLSIPFTKEQLRKKYREMVKKYHPDCNQNTLEAEEKIRCINQAYQYLLTTYSLGKNNVK